jgi:hypothetical protein
VPDLARAGIAMRTLASYLSEGAGLDGYLSCVTTRATHAAVPKPDQRGREPAGVVRLTEARAVELDRQAAGRLARKPGSTMPVDAPRLAGAARATPIVVVGEGLGALERADDDGGRR